MSVIESTDILSSKNKKKGSRDLPFFGEQSRSQNQRWYCYHGYRIKVSVRVFIAEKILLSHEPVYGLSWCLNIHGHDHSEIEHYQEGCKHLNLADNVCDYTPINLGKLIKEGVLSDIAGIHRMTIDMASRK